MFSPRVPAVLVSFLFISLLLVSFAAPCVVHADDIAVPGDFPTIQDAVEFAQDGDIVLVSEGVYFENIDFIGKAIEVRSVDGPGETTIVANLPGSVVTFQSGESVTSVIEGFTILNPSGNGVLCENSSPTIRGNIITVEADIGGGVSCQDSGSPVIEANEIVGCVAGLGGGILASSGTSPLISGNSIRDCSAQFGGGVATFSSTATLVNNFVISAELYLYFSEITATNNTIVDTPTTFIGTDAVVFNTIFHESGVGVVGQSNVEISFSNVNNWFGPGQGNVFTQYPGFADPFEGDYHLSFISPLINIGSDTAPAFPATDVDGEPRPQSGSPDIGADETPFDPGQGALGFIRGDANADGVLQPIPDAIFILFSVFVSGSPDPPCLDAADADDSGTLDALIEALHILALLQGGPPLPPPFPDCGDDPTLDGLGCLAYVCP